MSAAPSVAEREAIFKAFGRAFFKEDLDALYQVVTEDFVWSAVVDGKARHIRGRQAVGAYFAERRGLYENVRFHDVIYHHAPEASFMTFRLTATNKATGAPVDEIGVERYTFRDGKLAVKDVYLKPAG
ncbi:nuclear transport factor 2 family protein [Desertibaculum subflavum]|uniref:nuclear transport factor 2 family protein n=1 Tax=Desertibaculum subflavum TaxID=2268458 RepID=UPI0013C4115C